MKKNYMAPTFDVEIICNEDILTLSNGGEGSGSVIDWGSNSNGSGLY